MVALFYGAVVLIFSLLFCETVDRRINGESQQTPISEVEKSSRRLSAAKKNVTRSLDPVTVIVGRLTYITIPFHQIGGSSFYSEDWNFMLRTADNQPLFERSWIQYSKDRHQIEAFPLRGNEGHVRFLVIPWIANQKSQDRYFIDVDVKREENLYMHQVIFNIGSRNSARINRQRKFRIEFIELLATYLSSMGLYVRLGEIQILDSNPSTGDIKWLITSVKQSTCHHDITQLLPTFLLKNNKPNMNLLTVFSRKSIVISHVKIELFPPCNFHVSDSKSYTNHEFLAPLIVIIVIIVLVSPVVIAIVIRRRFRNNQGTHQQTHATNYTHRNQALSFEHVTNYGGNTNRKFSFSCWMFSRKGKSFKVNRDYRNRNKGITENIFHPNYLQRQRLRANSSASASSTLRNSPIVPPRSRDYKEQRSNDYTKQTRQTLGGISDTSSHPSFSTSQDTYQSSFDKRRYSPTNYQPPQVSQYTPQNPPQHIIHNTVVTSQQQDTRPWYQRNNHFANQPTSLIHSVVSKVCDFVVNDGVVNSAISNNQSRRPSVHLINTKPKTVNISQYQEQSPHHSTLQVYNHNSPNNHRRNMQSSQLSVQRCEPRLYQQDQHDSSRYYSLPRRHSFDTRQAAGGGDLLRDCHQRSFERKFKNVISRSTSSTPTKSSTLKVNALSHRNRSRSTEHAHQSAGSLDVNQRYYPAPTLSSEQIDAHHRSSSAIDLKRAASTGHIKNKENSHIHQHISVEQPTWKRHHHDNDSNTSQRQHQQHTNCDVKNKIPERKTSLARRQEFLASRRKAIELCSHDEKQYFCHPLPLVEDIEDTV